MKNNNKGFTLMEMLIVVAIIAVLVAIAIPTFSNALEKSREATDQANIRAVYAEVMASALTETQQNGVTKSTSDGKNTYTKDVTAVQKQAGWEGGVSPTIGGVSVDASVTGWTVSYVDGNNNATITAKTK